MQITLSSDEEAIVRSRVDSGAYRSSAEVIQEALRLLLERDLRLEALRRDIAIGIEQADRGELVPLDTEATKAEARIILAERRASM